MTSMAYAAGPVGFMLAGPLVDRFGLTAAFLALAVPILAIGLVCPWIPALRELDREPQMRTGRLAWCWQLSHLLGSLRPARGGLASGNRPRWRQRRLRPLVRMTAPPELRGARIDDLPTGRRARRSWLLLFGVLPVDFDDLTIAEHGPGHRFREESRMLTQSRWNTNATWRRSRVAAAWWTR